MRVPGDAAEAATPPGGYGVEPVDSGTPAAAGPRPDRRASTPVKARKTSRKKASADETAIWDGLIQAPARPEVSLRESLLYPLWGATGVALLVIFPPLLWFASQPFLMAVEAPSAGQSPFGIGVLFLLFPPVLAFGAVFGYLLLYLGRVAASSALGEVHHPRWPDWDLSAIVFGLGRWLWAGLTGGVVGGVPAVVYWVYCGEVDLFDYLILAELLAVGAVYALMALLASILHEDALAANPVTVAAAIWKSGWGYAQPCLLAGFAVVVAATLLGATFKVKANWLSAFLFWVFWVVALYEAMVVLRVLGLFYHKHARELGWFRGRTGWGV
jgi:hypothetical protein